MPRDAERMGAWGPVNGKKVQFRIPLSGGPAAKDKDFTATAKSSSDNSTVAHASCTSHPLVRRSLKPASPLDGSY